MVQRLEEHSDVETSTASDESGVHHWTVVTSPLARAAAAVKAASVPEEGEVSSPIATELKPAAIAAATPVTPPRPGKLSGDPATVLDFGTPRAHCLVYQLQAHDRDWTDGALHV